MDTPSPSDRFRSRRSSTAADAPNLLAAGILAGPVYVITSSVEVIMRPGFDLTRHSLSLLRLVS